MHWLIASGFIGSSASRVVIALLVAATAGLLVIATTVLLGQKEARVERQLAGYDRVDPLDYIASAGTGAGSSMIESPETAVVQSAVAFTSRLADRAGVLVRTELMLEQADVPLRAAELLFYTPAFAIVAFLLLAVIVGPLAGLIGAIVVAVAPFAYL